MDFHMEKKRPSVFANRFQCLPEEGLALHLKQYAGLLFVDNWDLIGWTVLPRILIGYWLTTRWVRWHVYVKGYLSSNECVKYKQNSVYVKHFTFHCNFVVSTAWINVWNLNNNVSLSDYIILHVSTFSGIHINKY